ncbi:MAG: hypothetical protein H6732_03340 [Alphaproteobacteria bacterium]|nr:hypothetical protein [Alphaproteobacteria bacterium]
MRASFVFLLTGLGACVPTAQTYLDDVQLTYCTRLFACEPETAEATHGDVASCASDGDSDLAKATECLIDACEGFDAGKAIDGVASIRDADCGDLAATTVGALDDPYLDCNIIKAAVCAVAP